jgi:hypothetical protein
MKRQRPTPSPPTTDAGTGGNVRLRRRTLRQLTPSELGQVMGGGMPRPTTSSEALRCDTDTAED